MPDNEGQDGCVDFGDHKMFVVGYTAGGVPYGVDLWYRDSYTDDDK